MIIRVIRGLNKKEEKYETNYYHFVNHYHHHDPGHLLMTWECNQGRLPLADAPFSQMNQLFI